MITIRMLFYNALSSSRVKLGIPEEFTLVILDLRDYSIALDIHLIRLDPGLPILLLSLAAHPFLMLPNCLLFVLLGEVVSDFVPDSDPLKAFERGICRLLIVHFLHPWVFCLWRLFMCLLKLFKGDFFQERAHYQRIDKLIVAITADLLTLDELVVETV